LQSYLAFNHDKLWNMWSRSASDISRQDSLI
jgi:hypothetical protein